MNSKNLERILQIPFASVYPHYITKAEKKGRTKAEVDEIIEWLTGYNEKKLIEILENKTNFEIFFKNANLHPNAEKIKGKICGHQIEEIENPLMKKIRYLDKLIDELAKGKKMDKILRQ